MYALKKQYRADFMTWAIIGGAITYPFAVLLGRRAQTYQGGVPVVPYQRWIDDHPNVHPSRTTNKFFRRYAGVACIVGGYIFGRYMADESILNNETYTRPDLKPFPAMVKERTDYDSEVVQQLIDKNYLTYKSTERKKSPLYRLLWPEHADFTPKTNSFNNRENMMNYNYVSGDCPTLHNTYADHRL
jgi:hypothetical protein